MKPTWLLKNTLTRKELEVVATLRKIPKGVRDDFEKMLLSFLDEEERIAEFCSYYESLLEGERYMMECSYDRDYLHDLHLQSVA